MENDNRNQQIQDNAGMSNIIFGTSSDAIEEGLHNGQFMEPVDGQIDDKNLIVNEQEQNEVINSSEEGFNQGTSPEATVNDAPKTAENTIPSAIKEEKKEEIK